jgi:hypothetical protein
MALVVGAALSLVGLSGGPAAAAQSSVNLGLAAPFAVLGGSTVTNTGPSVLNGNLGLSPGTSVTGFPPGTVNGASDITDATAANAQIALTTAYGFAKAAAPSDDVNYSTIGGRSLVPGVYNATSSMNLTGTVTLVGSGVYIFQMDSTLTAEAASTVLLTDGAEAGCVFWQVGSSATLLAGAAFNGTIMSAASITLVTGANVTGRLLAETPGAVTLDTNVITVPAACRTATTTTTGLINNTTLVAPTGTEVAGASFHDTSTVVGAGGAVTGTVTYSFFANGTCAGTPVSTDAATIAGSGAVPDSTTTGALAAGSYSFEATYGGDASNLGGVSACEPFVVLPGVLPGLVVSTTTTGLINNATLVAPTGTEVAGASFHDTSTVVGASGAATGTVTYSFFANGTCAGTPVSTDTVTIAGSGAVPNSTTTGALVAGSYSFEATYSGDTTYLGGVSACEPFVVHPAVIPPVVIPPVVIPPVVTPPVVTPPVVTAPVVTAPAVTAPAVTAPVVTAPVAAAASPTGTVGSGTGTSPVARSGASTTGSRSSGTASATPSVVLPAGAPSTGFGGAARSGDNELMVALGAAALLAALAMTGLGLRRRRNLIALSDTDMDEL